MTMVALVGCSAADDPPTFRSIAPVCVESEAATAGWTCPEPLEVECSRSSVPREIYVGLAEGGCGTASLLPVEGPFEPGDHEIVIVDDVSGTAVCSAPLVVTDAFPPEFGVRDDLSMWPPNHKLHAFDVRDCIVDLNDCDADPQVRLTWASSDEPDNATGDGNTSDDIHFVSQTHFELRAERQGSGNGRVYHVGFEVEDNAGHVTTGVCDVVVPHDQSGRDAVDDGEAYRVDAD